jgi:hypothetical protein
MKRFLTSLVSFTGVLLAVLIGSVFALPDNRLCNSMLGVQREKLDRLARLEGPRIIFVGGSNVGHGFDSSVVEKAFGRPVMNMGLHAGLGLIYHMRSIQDLVHKGDLVVVVPEYDMFADSCWGDAELLGMVSAIIPEHRKLLSFGQFCRLLLKAPQYGARKLMRFSALFESKKAHDDYNEQGDSLEWHKKKMRLPFPSLTKTVSRSQFTGQVMPYIEGFVASCRSRGASVVFLPPVYERTSYEHSKGFIEAIVESLAERQLPFIAAPIRYAFPDEEFADTNYHLNGRGVPRRVRYIAEDLKPKILASLNK